MFNIPTPLQKIENEVFDAKGLQVYVKRDDLIHPLISGNKWRKLKLNIEQFKARKYDKLLTFGGAYSNHIAATAEVGKLFNIPTIGIIRGDELTKESNETLKNAATAGMKLYFTSREEYALRNELYYHHELARRHGNVYIVPEGGSNYLGMLGCAEITKETHIQPDFRITAAGTGTTAAGLVLGSTKKVVVIPVLKNGDFIKDEIIRLFKSAEFNEEIKSLNEKLILKTEYHFGGYGKFNDELINFIEQIEKDYNLPLDQIYTGKMFYGFLEMVKNGEFPEGSRIHLIHTGGLQGKNSIID